jgi:hypothetical protein
MKAINIHRFGDKAALAILGQDGGTVYMDAKAARKVARQLYICARSIERESFIASSVVLQSVNIGKGEK